MKRWFGKLFRKFLFLITWGLPGYPLVFPDERRYSPPINARKPPTGPVIGVA